VVTPLADKATPKPDTIEVVSDRKGFVEIEKGEEHAKVLPASVNAWLRNGWKLTPKTKVGDANVANSPTNK